MKVLIKVCSCVIASVLCLLAACHSNNSKENVQEKIVFNLDSIGEDSTHRSEKLSNYQPTVDSLKNNKRSQEEAKANKGVTALDWILGLVIAILLIVIVVLVFYIRKLRGKRQLFLQTTNLKTSSYSEEGVNTQSTNHTHVEKKRTVQPDSRNNSPRGSSTLKDEKDNKQDQEMPDNDDLEKQPLYEKGEGNQCIELSIEQPSPTILYFPNPTDDVFECRYATEIPKGGESIFRFEINGDSANFEVMDDDAAVSLLRNNLSFFLGVIEEKEGTMSQSNGIVTYNGQWGQAKLQDDKWIVIKKLQIKYV